MTANNTNSLPNFSERLVQARVPATVEEHGLTAEFTFADVPALTAALRAGDDLAFRWLHARWNARLSRYCFALAGGDDALAGEIAQSTYLRLARHIRVLPGEDSLWNWIALAARCAAFELRRNGGRYRNALARFADWLRLRRSEIAPDADAALHAALDAALGGLTSDEQEIIHARYFQRHSLEDIGVKLGTSCRAIEGRLARLREKLRRAIADELLAQKSSR